MGLGKQIQVWEGIPLQCHPKEYHCSIVFRGLTTDNERTIKSLEFLFFSVRICSCLKSYFCLNHHRFCQTFVMAASCYSQLGEKRGS